MTHHSSEHIILEQLQQPEQSGSDRYKVFFRFLLDNLSQGNRLHLYTLFSKIAYLDGLVNFSDIELRAFHTCRKYIESGKDKKSKRVIAAFQFSLKRLLMLTSEFSDDELDMTAELNAWLLYDKSDHVIKETNPFIRAAILAVDQTNSTLFLLEEETGRRIEAKFNVAEVNEQFNISIAHLDVRISLPVMAHFIENRFINEQTMIPSAIVIDPDYLIDVTSIAESFTHNSELPLIYLMRQFMPKSSSSHLLIGNIANSILDGLMMGETISYERLMTSAFQQFALDFTLLSDEEVLEVTRQTKQLIDHLYQDVTLLKKENQNAIAYIEPTFISDQFGIQGRLDALFLDENFKAGKIVELKSGKPYKENEFGLNRNHYVQTLLYDMAIKSAFGAEFKSINYILYCKLGSDRLKQAPTIKSIGYDALKIRNDLVAIQHHLMTNKSEASLAFRFDHAVFAQTGGFIFRDAQFLHAVTLSMTKLERLHFTHFCSLIASENYMSKVGGEITRNSMGFAALWRSDAPEKESQFNILRHMKIHEKLDNGLYRFSLDAKNELSNFRRGDIVVLYPHSRESAPIKGQLLKGSLIELSNKFVDIKLRNPLIQAAVFESISFWNAEHDFIESSSRNIYRSLFAFYQMHRDLRSVYMGLTAPSKILASNDVEYRHDLSALQNKLLVEMLHASPYYLLWGPPGTGKTSIMLAAFVDHIMARTKESILLIAYTNRAVDEICAVLENNYASEVVRIGSTFSVPKKWQANLLQNQIRALKTRAEVTTHIKKFRIYVGTLASVAGKEELFSVKHFDRMVVDEASQILEPQILGLLTKTKQVVFIGDHKQLPAVVVSPAASTTIERKELNDIGYHDSSISLFERLYRRCEAMNWEHAIGRLDCQGRMHKQINDFVSNHFYQAGLKIVTHDGPTHERLVASLEQFYTKTPKWNNRLLEARLEFVEVEHTDVSTFELTKMNDAEATIVNELCLVLLNSLPENGTIGVICPFRAQIALIKQKLETQFDEIPSQLTIDTVERYQGGARDVVIISTCATNRTTLSAIRSIDRDGVDRKLNVALSRAREQIIVVGNRQVLETDICYKELIGYAEQLGCKQ